MPVVRYTSSHDDTFHYRAESLSPKKANRILPSDQLLRRRSDYLSIDTQDVPNDHPTSSRRRAPHSGDYTNQPEAVLQDTPTDSDDVQYHRATQPGETNSTQHRSDTELTSQEHFDQEVMIYYQEIDDSSLASQFLNLDDETLPRTDQTVTPKLDSPSPPSGSVSTVSTEGTLAWDFEPNSFHLLDTKRFETVTDLDGEKKTTPWPWGNYEYRPPTPPTYFDPEGYVMEFQLAEVDRALREELTEVMAQEAILDGNQGRSETTKRRETEDRKEGKKKRRIEKEYYRPTTVAFNNQVVRGRTIYNP